MKDADLAFFLFLNIRILKVFHFKMRYKEKRLNDLEKPLRRKSSKNQLNTHIQKRIWGYGIPITVALL